MILKLKNITTNKVKELIHILKKRKLWIFKKLLSKES